MDVFQCVSTLSSVRSYIDKEIPDDIIFKILEAGRLAPSAHNDQPWEFILLKNKNRIREIKQYCLSGSFISQAAIAVIILTDKFSKWKDIDPTRAAQNMALTAWSFGIGTCWIGRIDKPGIMKYCSIPDKWDILTVLPFGYYDDSMVSEYKSRKRRNEIINLDEYGRRLTDQ